MEQIMIPTTFRKNKILSWFACHVPLQLFELPNLVFEVFSEVKFVFGVFKYMSVYRTTWTNCLTV